jgi:hypothetical protein
VEADLGLDRRLALVKGRNTKSISAAMEQIVDATNARPPSVGGSVGLGLTWFVGLALSAVTLALVYAPPRPSASEVTLPGLSFPPPGPPRLKLGDQGDFSLRAPQVER